MREDLTPTQAYNLGRAEMALGALSSWANDLQDKDDIVLLEIVSKKIKDLNRSIDFRRLQDCQHCGQRAILEDNTCPYCGKQKYQG